MNKKYLAELEPAYTPLTVCEEASRCLLCLDAPCSKIVRPELTPDVLFALCGFVILKVQLK